jgi:hypothetical protein
MCKNAIFTNHVIFERLPDIVVVLAFTTRFLCPGFRATLLTMGTVKVPSVDVTDTELFDLNVKSLFSRLIF